MGCHFLHQGIFLIQGWNCLLCLLHWQVDSLPLSHQGSPTLWAGEFLAVLLPLRNEEELTKSGDG